MIFLLGRGDHSFCSPEPFAALLIKSVKGFENYMVCTGGELMGSIFVHRGFFGIHSVVSFILSANIGPFHPLGSYGALIQNFYVPYFAFNFNAFSHKVFPSINASALVAF